MHACNAARPLWPRAGSPRCDILTCSETRGAVVSRRCGGLPIGSLGPRAEAAHAYWVGGETLLMFVVGFSFLLLLLLARLRLSLSLSLSLFSVRASC